MISNKLTLIVIVFICFFNGDYPFTLGFLGKAVNIRIFTNIIVYLSFFIVFVNFKKIIKEFRFWVLILIILLGSLVVQSLIQYNVFFKYPHVFFKILVPFVFFATYILTSKVKANYLDIFSKLIIFFYVFDLIVLGWIRYYSPLSLYIVDPTIGGAGDSRVFHARIVYLFILTLLYYYSKYLKEKKNKFLIISIVIGSVLLFQNHRSIWVTGTISLLTLIFLYLKSVNLSKIFKTRIIISLAAIAIIITAIFLSKDSSIFAERFSDIIDWQTQGTGLWRYEQVIMYLPLIYNNIIWGLRFSGFDVNIVGPAAGFFQSGTGHHFHNGFIDIIFYHGIVGLILLYGLIIAIIVKLSKIKSKSVNDFVAIAFLFGVFPFSFAYQIPFSFWGIAGVMTANSLSNTTRSNSNTK